MANLGGNFDATTVEPQGEYTPIPAGEYRVHIVSSDKKQNKAQTGHFWELQMEILDGDQQGRKVTERLNLDNPNATAVDIAARTLSAICHATGKLSVNDTEELHNLPMVAKVVVTPPRGEYGPGNEIKAYKPDAAGFSAGAKAGAAAGGSFPWKK